MLFTAAALLLPYLYTMFLLVKEFLFEDLPLWIEIDVIDPLKEWSSEEWEIFFVLAGMSVLWVVGWIMFFEGRFENVIKLFDDDLDEKYLLPVHKVDPTSAPKAVPASPPQASSASEEHSPHISAKRDSRKRAAFEWPDWMSHFNPNSPRDRPTYHTTPVDPNATFSPNLGKSSVRVKMYGEMRWVQRQPTYEVEVEETTVAKEPEVPQVLVFAKSASSGSVEATNPTQDASPPSGVLQGTSSVPTLMVPPPLAIIEQPSPSEINSLLPPPDEPPLIIAQPSVPTPLPTLILSPPSPPPPSHESMLFIVLENLNNGSGILQRAMLLFLDLTSLEGCWPLVKVIADWAHNALQALLPFFPQGLPFGASSELHWIGWFEEFWGKIQPFGHMFQAFGDAGLWSFYEDTLAFGLYLGLMLEAPNFKAPTPPPPMVMFSSAPPIQHQQIAANFSQAAPTPPTKKPSVAFDFQGAKHLPSQNFGQVGRPQQTAKKGALAPVTQAKPTPMPTQAPPATSSGGPSQTVGSLPEMPIDFDDDDDILGLKASKLRSASPRSFGWVGDEQIGVMLWGEKSFKGYELVLKDPKTLWSKEFVKGQLEFMAKNFKRATIMMFLQANWEPSRQHFQTAPLVTNTKHFLNKAWVMTDHCKAEISEISKWTVWIEACEFFDQCLCANSKVEPKLKETFRVDGYMWQDLQTVWDEKKDKWLSMPEEATGNSMDADEALALFIGDD